MTTEEGFQQAGSGGVIGQDIDDRRSIHVRYGGIVYGDRRCRHGYRNRGYVGSRSH